MDRHRVTRWRLAARALALGGLLWLAAGLGVELWRAVDAQVLAPPFREIPILWRFGTPSPERLRRFIDASRPHLPPPGSRVVFSSPTSRRGEATIRFLWAVYFLPTHQLIPADRPQAAEPAVWLSFGEQRPRADLEPLLEVAGSGVYRRRPSPDVSP